jgi:hypothetical protein
MATRKHTTAPAALTCFTPRAGSPRLQVQRCLGHACRRPGLPPAEVPIHLGVAESGEAECQVTAGEPFRVPSVLAALSRPCRRPRGSRPPAGTLLRIRQAASVGQRRRHPSPGRRCGSRPKLAGRSCRRPPVRCLLLEQVRPSLNQADLAAVHPNRRSAGPAVGDARTRPCADIRRSGTMQAAARVSTCGLSRAPAVVGRHPHQDAGYPRAISSIGPVFRIVRPPSGVRRAAAGAMAFCRMLRDSKPAESGARTWRGLRRYAMRGKGRFEAAGETR